MKKLIIAVAVMAIGLAVFPLTGYADDFYVIRDQNGNMGVTNGVPVYPWSVQSGPYSTIDEAQRATGVGTGYSTPGFYNRLGIGEFGGYLEFPQVVPRRPGQSPMVDLVP